MGLQIALQPFVAHWPMLALAAAVIVIFYVFAQIASIRVWGPRDTVGNGIAIGNAKAFDNRALTLRIERLSAGLAALKVVNQNFADNILTFQGRTSTDSTRSLSFSATPPTRRNAAASNGGISGDKNHEGATPSPSGAQAPNAKADFNDGVGIASSDILNDQLSLASQIVNLETLYERSLTDRLIGDRARLQTVLGFQISISAPAGYENCVAVAEVAIRVKGTRAPVSLVALIPQEKTYNAQSVSRTATSIEGSAVAEVLKLGATGKGESRELFVHRDSDTVAFERDPRSVPTLFADDKRATVFGWEFRPVLGRTTVSAGTRQMLAVIAVPAPETPVSTSIILEVRRRSYWRRYDRKRQTSRPKWRPFPWKIDGSNTIDFAPAEIAIPSTAKIQRALSPSIADVKWVSCGGDQATVIVSGANFFSGTKVVIDGRVHREEDGTLTLKSEQALEFGASIASLTASDAVLIGRFGSAIPLTVPEEKRPVRSISIERANIQAFRYTTSYRIAVDVIADDENLTVDALRKLSSEPLLFVGTEAVPMPYDYSTEEQVLTTPASGVKKFVRVQAWVPQKMLTRNASVSFRVPFCSSDYDSSQPVSFAEPTVTRMGGDETTTVFRIQHPLGFSSDISVDLDRTYLKDGIALDRTSNVDFRFSVDTNVVSRYQNMVVRVGSAEPYLVPIPIEDSPKPVPSLDLSGKPPQVMKGSLGPVEWTGTALDTIVSATLHTSAIPAPQTVAPSRPAAPQPNGPPPSGAPAQFITSAAGGSIQVYFSNGDTEALGKATVEFQTAAGRTLRAPFFIVKPTA